MSEHSAMNVEGDKPVEQIQEKSASKSRSNSPQRSPIKSPGKLSAASPVDQQEKSPARSKTPSRSKSRSRSRSGSRSYGRRSPPPPRRRRTSNSISPHRNRSRSRSRDKTSYGENSDNPGNNLYIGNLSFKTDDRDLERAFGGYGRVSRCEVVRDPYTKKSRGFGFVTYDELENARRASREMNGVEIHGRRLKVEISRRAGGHTRTPGESSYPRDGYRGYSGRGRSDRGYRGDGYGGDRGGGYGGSRGDRYNGGGSRYNDRGSRDYGRMR
eukprot:CAMPEP_0171476980 /NCGR_PEP_ID=MMETSP0946-20130122/3913_1 /TAXON_ID=109269 /ORGANISM="Vaucheria litorea, Strain CCMP2940" /LENGTH=269 /DNA_ID=CAMNT_0012007345 /DNA_START=76 /DNA_END=885 /DNA_ORIENTATION=-